MRRQLCNRVPPDCCKTDRLAGAKQAGAVANGPVMGSVTLILGLTAAPSWRGADISCSALVFGRPCCSTCRSPRPPKNRRPTRLQPLRLTPWWMELFSHRPASRAGRRKCPRWGASARVEAGNRRAAKSLGGQLVRCGRTNDHAHARRLRALLRAADLPEHSRNRRGFCPDQF